MNIECILNKVIQSQKKKPEYVRSHMWILAYTADMHISKQMYVWV